MALGSTLARVVTLVKREIGASLAAGSADDARIQQAVEVAQEELAASFAFSELADMWDATASSRWTAFPTTGIGGSTTGIDFSQHPCAYVRHNSIWMELDEGITLEHYNVKKSDFGETQDPPERWAFKQGDRASFELWPVPATTQTIRFVGSRKLNTLRSSGSLDTTKTLDLDDILVALYIAVDWLGGEKKAGIKGVKFQERLNRMKANNVQNSDRIIVGGETFRRKQRLVPIAVA